jgi:hypothetical protein
VLIDCDVCAVPAVPIVATCIYAQPDCINFIISRVRWLLGSRLQSSIATIL